MSKLRIVIPGGTGRLALFVAKHFHAEGHSVSTLSRFPKPRAWEAVHWDGETVGDWLSTMDDADAVVDFSARPVVAQAIVRCVHPPRVWLRTGESAISLPKDTRTVQLRLSPVMSTEFGAFPMLLRLVQFGLGGQIGSGREFINWIHEFDFLRAVDFLIDRDDMAGYLDIASPWFAVSSDFMRDLRDAWSGIPFGVPTPAALMRLAQPGLLSNGRPGKVQQRLMASGFVFEWPEWQDAAEDLVGRWRLR